MMRGVYCVAVDLGATSGRVVLGRWAQDRLALTFAHRFSNAIRPLGGHDYWDIGTLWHEIRTGLERAAVRLPPGAKIASVGVDAWGNDHVLVDAAGRPVFPVHAYRDGRTRPQLARLGRDTQAMDRLYQATGIPAAYYNASLQLAETVSRYPSVRKLVHRCLFLSDYFNFLLSGKMEQELTTASPTQLLDVQSSGWSQTALAYFGVPKHWLQPAIAAGSNLGAVRGFQPLSGAQVIAVPGHDTACAFDAMPSAESGDDLYLSVGTWALVGCESATPLLGSAAQQARIANERMGDGHYRPLLNLNGLWLLEGVMKDLGVRPRNAAEWKELIAAGTRAPPPPRLLDITAGAFSNPVSMRAAIDRFLKKHRATPPRRLAGYLRLVCDSLGHSHATALRTLERLSGRRFRRIIMVGGGSKNPLLCQATASAAGRPVDSFSLEGSAVGNIARQLIALGAVPHLAAVRAALGRQLKGSSYRP